MTALRVSSSYVLLPSSGGRGVFGPLRNRTVAPRACGCVHIHIHLHIHLSLSLSPCISSPKGCVGGVWSPPWCSRRLERGGAGDGAGGDGAGDSCATVLKHKQGYDYPLVESQILEGRLNLTVTHTGWGPLRAQVERSAAAGDPLIFYWSETTVPSNSPS